MRSIAYNEVTSITPNYSHTRIAHNYHHLLACRCPELSYESYLMLPQNARKRTGNQKYLRVCLYKEPRNYGNTAHTHAYVHAYMSIKSYNCRQHKKWSHCNCKIIITSSPQLTAVIPKRKPQTNISIECVAYNCTLCVRTRKVAHIYRLHISQ